MEIETSYPHHSRVAISWDDDPDTDKPVPTLLVVPDTTTNAHSHIMLTRDGATALRNVLTAMLDDWDKMRGDK